MFSGVIQVSVRGQEVKSLEGGVGDGGDGVRLLDSQLAVPQFPQHFNRERQRWVAQVERGVAPGRLEVALFPVGCQSNSDGGKAHGYDEREEIRFLGFLEGLPQRDSVCLRSQGPDANYK